MILEEQYSKLLDDMENSKIVTQERVSVTIKELQEKLIHIRKALIYSIESISTQLERSKNEILTKVKRQFTITDHFTQPKESHSINSSLNEGSTELCRLLTESHDTEDRFKTPEPRKHEERFTSVQRLRTAGVEAGSLTVKEISSISREEEDLSFKDFSSNESKNVEESEESDIEELVKPTIVFEDDDNKGSSKDSEEEEVVLSINAMCIDKNDQYIVVP